MNDVEVEILPLEGVDLEGTVPCEAIPASWWDLRSGRQRPPCGRPAVARMRVRCLACGADYRLFLCRRDVWWFRMRLTIACRACHRVGRCASR